MKLKYFYKVNVDGTPIAGTLAAYRVKPTTGNWKEVPNNACCIPTPSGGCATTTVSWYSGFAMQEANDGLYLYIWSPGPSGQIFPVLFPQGEVTFYFENYADTVQVFIDGELILTIPPGTGGATTLVHDMTGVCTFEMIPVIE